MCETPVSLKVILDALNDHQIRATYGAVGELIGWSPVAVGKSLGERCPRASWVVNAKSLKPTDYLKEQEHPELYRTDHVIRTAAELRQLVGEV